MKNRTVITLGKGRCGSSMIAGILSKLGVDMGDDGEYKDPSYNRWGYWQNKEILKFNQVLIQKEGLEWEKLPSEEETMKLFPEYKEEVKALVEKHRKEPIWGWKEERTLFTYPLFLQFVENPYFIVIHREMEAHVGSSMRSSGLRDPVKTRETIENYYLRVDELFKKHKYPRLDVKYDDFFKRANKEIKRMIDFLGISPTKKQIKDAKSHIHKRV